MLCELEMLNRVLVSLTIILSLNNFSARNCPWGNEPMCGVDYTTYPNQCALATAYVELLHTGPCTKVMNDDGSLVSKCP